VSRWIDRALQICRTNYRVPTGYHGRINFLYIGMMITNTEQILSLMKYLATYADAFVPRFIYRYRQNDRYYVQTQMPTKLLTECFPDEFALDGMVMIDAVDYPILCEHEIPVHALLELDSKTVVKGMRLVPLTKPPFRSQFMSYSSAPTELRGQFRLAYDEARAALFVRMANSGGISG